MTREVPPPRLTGGALTRSRILDAAATLLATVGVVRTTTKEIAREAGYSEATLYKHFRDKEEIFIRVLHERAPSFPETLANLPTRAGAGDPAEHLRGVARVALPFYRDTFPMAGSLFASPELLATHRKKLDLTTAGPQSATRQLAAYLAAEQGLGRISPNIDAHPAAALLIGACFHRAFLDLFLGADAPPGALVPELDEDFVAQSVAALFGGIAARAHADS